MAAAPAAAVLQRDLADLLVQLSIALHKHAIYPQGHPMMRHAADELAIQLDAVLARQESLSVGVARQQLVIEGVATDERNPLLRELAVRLNRHRLAGVRFRRGVHPSELAQFLDSAAVDPDTSGVVLGRNPPAFLGGWEHVVLYPLTVGQLALVDDDESVLSGGADDASLAQLWIGLARAAIAGDPAASLDGRAGDDAGDVTDPMAVADAIDRRGRDEAYDQVVVGYLLQIAGEMKDRPAGESAAVSRRVSQLVTNLEPETIRRLLQMGGDVGQRKNFMLTASHGFSADAVVKLVEAAASGGLSGTVSESMLRLLGKLARHSNDASSSDADGAVREQVQSLLVDWTLADPNPAQYRQLLEGMARSDVVGPEEAAVDSDEDERLVQMGMEIGSVGPRVLQAVERMWSSGRIARLVSILDAGAAVPEQADVAAALWRVFATEARLRALLEAERVDLSLVERVATEIGEAAADPLFDALEIAEDRSRRARLLDLLAQMGPIVGKVAVARLDGAPWFVQRNLLVLLARLPERPAGFSAEVYAAAADPRVRREAIKLLLRDPLARDDAVAVALRDVDPGIVHLGVAAAAVGCPAELAPELTRIAEGALEAPTRALAVRALSAFQLPEMREVALRLAAPRRTFFGAPRLAPASPVLAAALAALAERWHDDAEAQAVLRAAEKEGWVVRATSNAWVVTTQATGSARGTR
ncbi:MAG TPA: hypothetical protein VFY16_13815 [Gemmatimonadaceae bacterium]|nr:hypothetical protein [Gemmatimonadaceae bacterium]